MTGAVGTVFAHLRVATGTRFRSAWSALFAGLSRPRTCHEDQANRYALATFADDRRLLANTIALSGLVLDLDDGTKRPAIEAALTEVWCFVHSTKRATVDAPRWRVVIPASHPITPAEYGRCWRSLAMSVESAGIAPDYTASAVNKVWCVPLERPHFEAFEIGGATFDVDEALAIIPAETPLPPPEPTAIGSASAYVRSALERETQVVATAAHGVRNATLNRSAFALARFVADGKLVADDFESVLLAAGRAAGLSQRECLATIRSALRGRRCT